MSSPVGAGAQPPPTGLPAREFLAPVHAFRGFAIAMVVAAHSWGMLMFALGAIVPAFGPVAPEPGTLLIGLISETLFHDSTIFFALISGLLFTRVLKQRGWTAFFRGKVMHVAIPYVVVSALISLYGGDPVTFRLTPFSGSSADYAAKLGTNLVTGGAFFHLWYIPVLFILYASTPAVMWVLARPTAVPLVWILIAAPLLVSRVWPDLSWTTPVYFLGPYTVGMWVGLNYDPTLHWMGRHRRALTAVAVVCSLAVAAMFVLDIDKAGPVSLRESTWYVQKLAISGLALAWFASRDEPLGRLLNPLATFAFPIYFIHGYVVVVITELLLAAGVTRLASLAIFAGGFGVWIVATTLSLAIAHAARSLFGRHSRVLLGA